MSQKPGGVMSSQLRKPATLSNFHRNAIHNDMAFYSTILKLFVFFLSTILVVMSMFNYLSAQELSFDSVVSLRAIANNRYVAAQGDLDSVDVRASALSQDSRTHLILVLSKDDNICIKASSNHSFLKLDSNGDVIANANDISNASSFKLINNNNKTVSLQEIKTKKFLSVLPTIIKETRVSETFIRMAGSDNNNETVRPIIPNNRGYVSEPPIVGKLRAVSNSIGLNEQFIIEDVLVNEYKSLNRAPENSQVLAYLDEVKGQKTVAGLHNREPNSDPTKQTRVMYEKTGKYPALWSGDFLFTQSDIDNRQAMITEAINQWNQGALINIMWHASPPTGGVASNWFGGVQSELTDDQWNDLIRDGGYLNNIWKERLDNISYFLQQLEDEGVEVLFRPFHEMNQSAFWWAGRTGPNGTPKLYQLTRDYLEEVKGLTNLVWVWNVQDFDWFTHADYYVGDDYCDVASLDVYSNAGFPYSNYQSMYDIIGDRKPIAIGESNKIPSPEKILEQPNWCFFMTWSELTFSDNSDADINATYWDENVVTLDEMPGWDDPIIDTGINLAKEKPVTVSSTEEGVNVANNLVDGDKLTRWSSEYADEQNVIIDLQSNYTLDKVILRWEAAYAKEFQVQVSNDNEAWTTVFEDYSGNGGKDIIPLPHVSARYLKIYNITRSCEFGFSLWEVEAYGYEDQTVANNNTKLSRSSISLKFNAGNLYINTGINELSEISLLRVDGKTVYQNKACERELVVSQKSLGGKGILFLIVTNVFGKQIHKILNSKK